MYTEDDTFDALVKVPVNEILSVFFKWHDDEKDSRDWDAVLLQSKWTRREWDKFRANRTLIDLMKDYE